MSAAHIPVLLAETLAALEPRDDGLYLDGTFGGGGYSRALLEAARCKVVAIDRDPAAVRGGDALAQLFPGRLTIIEGRFGEMERLLSPLGIAALQGVALDLGVSSAQLDAPERGFSFRADGPLDMRMAGQGPSAADLVNTLPEAALAEIIRDYGEERHARRVARAIVRAREAAPITRTAALAELVRKAVPAAGRIDAATRTFRRSASPSMTSWASSRAASRRPSGCSSPAAGSRWWRFIRSRTAASRISSAPAAPGPDAHRGTCRPRASSPPSFRLLSRKPVVPGDAEIARNPRARSARLRAAERTAAPAWEDAA